MYEKVPDVMLELFDIRFLTGKNKSKALTKRVILFIISGRLSDQQVLPSIRKVHELTTFSKDTVAKSWRDLKSKNYIITVAGSHTRVNYQNGSNRAYEEVEINMYLDQQSIPAKGDYDKMNREINRFIADYNKGLTYCEPNVLNVQLLGKICSRLNINYATSYTSANISYEQHYYFALRNLGKILYRPNGVIIVCGNDHFEYREAFNSCNLRVITLNVADDDDFFEQLDQLLITEVVVGLVVSPNSGFPIPIPTSLNRIKKLITLHRSNRFAILGIDISSHWQTIPINNLLESADMERDSIIYLSRLSNLNHRFYKMIEVVSNVALIEKFNAGAMQFSGQNTMAVAAAAVEFLDSAMSRKLTRFALQKAAEFGEIVHKILTDSGFWEPAGITVEAWPAIYLVPKEGCVPDDVFEQAKAKGILIMHPKVYTTEPNSKRAILMDMSIYITKGSIESDTVKLDLIFRKMCLSVK